MSIHSSKKIYSSFVSHKKESSHAFALLVDPDSIEKTKLEALVMNAQSYGVDYIFVGGSIIVENRIRECVDIIKKNSDIPAILFPGSTTQVVDNADAILFLSLISGRNPDLLIGQQVISAPMIKQSGLEVLSTGYMIIDGGQPTTVSYMSHSMPIPHNKPDVALCTAWAGELLGKSLIYMDAGSGAKNPISSEMIHKVSSNIDIPLIVGGGIRTPEKIRENCEAGAQVVVIGNAIEKDAGLFQELVSAVKDCNKK